MYNCLTVFLLWAWYHLNWVLFSMPYFLAVILSYLKIYNNYFRYMQITINAEPSPSNHNSKIKNWSFIAMALSECFGCWLKYACAMSPCEILSCINDDPYQWISFTMHADIQMDIQMDVLMNRQKITKWLQ